VSDEVLNLFFPGLISIRPAGYQQSWGAAEEAVRLLKENLPK
jgi:hypothetical protein